MKISARNVSVHGKPLIAAAVASLLLSACATAPVKPDGADAARARLTQLQSNPDLATRAPVSMHDAEVAVRAAEQPQTDPEIGKYNVYMADRKVDIAMAQAQTALAVDQRAGFAQQSEQARLDERTREADLAQQKLASARTEIADQKSQAEMNRLAAADAAQRAAMAQQQSAADAALAAQQQSSDAAAQLAAQQAAQQTAEMQRLAVECYRAVECEGMARVDFLLESATGKLYINEINTIPGFTSISMYPKMWEYSGLPMPQLIDRLIELALQRHASKQRLRYSK